MNDQHHNLHLLNLPESLLYVTISYLPLQERFPTLLLISKYFTNVITNPNYLLSFQSSDDGDEILFVVGGSYPVRNNSNGVGGGRRRRRMELESNPYLWGYIPSLGSWRIFGGSLSSSSSCNREEGDDVLLLSPLEDYSAGYKFLFVPYPYYTLLVLGGYDMRNGEGIDRVMGYSFLFGRWESWPRMLNKRRGNEFHVVIVGEEKVYLIGCGGSEGGEEGLCKCGRCSVALAAMGRGGEENSNQRGMSSGSTRETFGVLGGGSSGTSGTGGIGVCGEVEVLNLRTRQWEAIVESSKPPTCPPDDGGIAVVQDRYICLPGIQQQQQACCVAPRGSRSETGETSMPSAAPLSDYSTEDLDSLVMAMHRHGISGYHDSDDDDGKDASAKEDEEEEEKLLLAAAAVAWVPLPSYSRPGLVYDTFTNTWSTLPSRGLETTISPTTIGYKNDNVLVMGGYTQSSWNDVVDINPPSSSEWTGTAAMTISPFSYYHLRHLASDDAILDYEEHVDTVWTLHLTDNEDEEEERISSKRGDNDEDRHEKGSRTGPQQQQQQQQRQRHQHWWSSSFHPNNNEKGSAPPPTAAIPATTATVVSNNNPRTTTSTTHQNKFHPPKSIPVPVRGGMALTYQNRLTFLGGLSTFSQTFDSNERKVIWQYDEVRSMWDRVLVVVPTTTTTTNTNDTRKNTTTTTTTSLARKNGTTHLEDDATRGISTTTTTTMQPLELPVKALLDGYAFSLHL